MALFQQKPEEQVRDWAGLPSEPLDPKSPAEALEDASPVDAFALGFGGATTSIAFPVAAPPPAAADTTTSEPDEDARA